MQVNWKKLIIPNIPYFFIGLFATKLGQAIRLAPGTNLSSKIMHFMEGMVLAFESSMPSFHPTDFCVGIAIALGIRLAVYVKGKNAKKFRKNLEYGSARWGGYEDIKPYIDPVFANNIILTQTESLTMNNRPTDPKTARNKNVLIIGGSGSGKTRFWLKPNLMQCTSKKYPVSFVVTDPKGSIVTECGKMLLRFGYRLKIMNTINFKKSMHYNPFAYIHSEKDNMLQSYPGNWSMRYNLTFRQLYCLILGSGYIGFLLMGFLIMWISAKTKSSVLAVLTPSVILLIPMFLHEIYSLFLRKVIGLLPHWLFDIGQALRYQYLYKIGDQVTCLVPIIRDLSFMVGRTIRTVN